MGVKEMLDRLYSYKNGAEDENLIDDVSYCPYCGAKMEESR